MNYAALGLSVATATWLLSPAPKPSAPAAPQQQGDHWTWHGSVAQGKRIEIRGINGRISATASTGGEVEVTADKHGRHDDPADVRIEVVNSDQGVTICAVYPGRGNTCAPGGGRMNVHDNDVQVDFTVKVPHGVAFDGNTVNGDIDATALEGPADVETVNGSITTDFPIQVQGHMTPRSLRGQIGSGGRELHVETVNGSVRIRRLGTQ